MSVTAVPLPPIGRRTLGWLWLGLAVLALAGIAAAWYGTRNIAAPAKIFLARNARKPGVVVMPSGLQYQVIRPGSGVRPTLSDIVLINYEGKLADGTLFDRGGPAPMAVNRTVPGFSEALTLMQVGSKYRLWIPPALGFPEGNGPIPPNSLLIFDVELLAVAPQSAMAPPAGMPPADTPPPASEMPQSAPPQSDAPAGVTVHTGEGAPGTPAQSAEPPSGPPAQ
jgi:FKBP-type peptidyl-prolyl cis-trans isomerase FkpA